MAIDSTHPLYAEFHPDWEMMRDMYRGERVVKSKGQQYLPATAGMHLDGMTSGQLGAKNYESYIARAVFPDYVKDGVEANIGLLHQKDATIELPSSLEYLRDNATVNGESILGLLRRVNEEQLVSGRIGLLLDIDTKDPVNPRFYIATYDAESILNWDENESGEGQFQLNMVTLDESGFERDAEFQWSAVTKYRILMLTNLTNEGVTEYHAGVFVADGAGSSLQYNPEQMVQALYKGSALEKIPFVFINTKDIVSEPDEPPLLGLARLSLAIYRGEADYRQSLFMQGQDTLVVVGGVRVPGGIAGEDDDAIRTGAGSRIDVDMGGDAKYIGVSSTGLSEQRQALENDRLRANTKAGQLINANSSNAESGEALKTRIAAQTATLNQIALASASGIESLIRIAAEWIGVDINQVKIVPNLEFADFQTNSKDIVDLMTARTMGAPLSKQSIHEVLVERGLTKLDYESEVNLIEEEDGGMSGPGSTPENDTNLNPDDNNTPDNNKDQLNGQDV